MEAQSCVQSCQLDMLQDEGTEELPESVCSLKKTGDDGIHY